MDRCIAFAPKLLPAAEAFLPEGRSCPGCGQALAVRLIAKAIGHHNRFPYGAVAPGVRASALPEARWTVFPGAARTGSGSRRQALKNISVVAADSGTFQDVIPVLRDAARRQQRFFGVCFFNEAGIERHPAAAGAAWHHDETKEFLQRLEYMYGKLETLRRLGLPFMATASAAHPFDLIEKVSQGLAAGGPAVLGVLTACPTGCRYPAAQARQSMRRAVRSGFFPLYTCANGRVTLAGPAQARQPVAQYLKLHHAFLYAGADDIAAVQQHVDAYLNLLMGDARTKNAAAQD